jgi:predicted dehydrogenase
MTDTVRWGIAGPGSIAARMAEALADLDGAELVAVGSRAHHRAAAFAAAHAVPRVYGSYDALLADDDVDVVYVATPHSSHHDLTVAALEAGRHVVCEKPFALSAAEAASMAETARRTGRFCMEAMWTWFLPTVVELRRSLAEGVVGDVRALRADFGIDVPGETGRHRSPVLGGGALLDVGVYPIALARLLLGPPSAVRALGRLGPTGVDDTVAGVLAHDSGALALFHAGIDARTTQTAEVTGTDGTITVESPFWAPTAFTVDRRDGSGDRVTLPHRGLAHEAAHANDRIRSGHTESDVIPLATSVALMGTLDEIRAQIGVRFPGETQAP